jgi:hypothetical protein
MYILYVEKKMSIITCFIESICDKMNDVFETLILIVKEVRYIWQDVQFATRLQYLETMSAILSEGQAENGNQILEKYEQL